MVGEQLAMLAFGVRRRRASSSNDLLHLMALPGAFVTLTGLHLWLVHRRTPTSPPGTDDRSVVAGQPLWPDLVRRLAVLGGAVTAVLIASAALIPWSDLELEGPFLPAEAANTLHPPWPLFVLSGALRILPPVDLTITGLHISGGLLAGAVIPGLLIGALAAYPFLEGWRLGDHGDHHVRDGLLDVPLRSGVLTSLFSASVLLSLAATVDVIAFRSHVPVEWVVRFFRVALVVGPRRR